jgi:hypothetical protein
MFRPVKQCQVMWMIHNKKVNLLRHTRILKHVLSEGELMDPPITEQGATGKHFDT